MLNESIIKIRCELQKKKLNKSGYNKFIGFNYFELADFLPALNELMQKEGVNDIFTIEDGFAVLKLIKEEDENVYKIPFTQFPTPPNKNGQPSMQDIQYLGALNTYYKRYLYLNAFGITDGEIIDAMDSVGAAPKRKEDPVITKEQSEELMGMIASAPGTDSMEVRVEGCLNKVGGKSIETLKLSQYEFLKNLFQKVSK